MTPIQVSSPHSSRSSSSGEPSATSSVAALASAAAGAPWTACSRVRPHSPQIPFVPTTPMQASSAHSSLASRSRSGSGGSGRVTAPRALLEVFEQVVQLGLGFDNAVVLLLGGVAILEIKVGAEVGGLAIADEGGLGLPTLVVQGRLVQIAVL